MSYIHPFHEWSSEIEVGKTIASLIRLTNAISVMEVGVFHGETSKTILESMPKASHYVGVDIEDLRQGDALASFKQASERGVVAEFIKGDSKQVLKQFAGHKFDIVFVDSMHHWSHILPEFMHAINVVRSGGLLIYHDSEHIADVKRLMNYATTKRFKKIDLTTPGKRGLTLLQR
jgi:predicted O-methyltransferase YrrM